MEAVNISVNSDFFSLHIGDCVSQTTIDLLRNLLSPVLDYSTLFQYGSVICDRFEEDGRLRPTYATFQKTAPSIWTYCGACFRGESKERGTVPIYEVITSI